MNSWLKGVEGGRGVHTHKQTNGYVRAVLCIWEGGTYERRWMRRELTSDGVSAPAEFKQRQKNRREVSRKKPVR